MKKLLLVILSCLLATATTLTFTSCKTDNVTAPTVEIGENGNWFIDGVDTGLTAKGDKGDQGVQGEKGDKGDDGLNGKSPVITIGENGNWLIDGEDTGILAKGEKGDQGIQGVQGEKGDKGDKGDQGNQGIQGEKGDKGDKGDQGIQGEKGDKGDQGIQGEKGDKGDKGDQGVQGEKGDKGDQGNQGIQGEKGDKGDKGDQGVQGEKGDKGDQGDQGIQGEKGDKGDQGIQGEKGDNGLDGKTPVITIGENGNWFIDGVDSNVSSKGQNGTDGKDGADGHTPDISIGDNGNWFIDGKDTGKPSRGEKGDRGDSSDGKTVQITYYTDDDIEYDCGFQTGIIGDLLKAPEAPTKDGYIFKGWYVITDNGTAEWLFPVYKLNKDTVKFIAKWEKAKYTLTVVAEEGGEAVANYYQTTVSVENGEIIKLKATADEGYTFSGWYDDQEKISDQKKYEYEFTLDRDVKLTAKFKINKYEISAISSDDTFGIVDITQSGALEHGTEIAVTAKPSKIYYKFYGWYNHDQFISDKEEYIFNATQNITLTAYFRIDEQIKPFTFEDNNDDTVTITELDDKNIVSATIPEYANIPDTAKLFQSCRLLRKVTFNCEISKINAYMFSGCSTLENIDFNSNVITEIDNNAFQNCKAIDFIDLSNVTAIGNNAFQNCEKLKDIDLQMVKTIGNYAFQNCKALEYLILPDTVSSIGNQAFRGCSNISRIEVSENKKYKSVNNCLINIADKTLILGTSDCTIPTSEDGVTTIGAYAFDGCSFTNDTVVITDGIEKLNNYAFYGCTATTYIIPTSVTTLTSAFQASAAKKITLKYRGSEDDFKNITGSTNYYNNSNYTKSYNYTDTETVE